jgi:hypothetical protein
MISVSLEGLKDVIEAVRAVPTALNRKTMFEGTVEEFTALLASKTPPGWSRNLKNSAMSDSVLVGYSAGVEKPGNETLDGKPRRGQKRWVSVDELETVLLEAVSEYSGSVLGLVAEEADSVLS